MLKCLKYKDQYLKEHFVFATAIILCHPASRSVFAPLMTWLLKEIMAPIISFHYEMKLSWKRMRKFHTLEIRFCKVLCPHPWVRAHQTPPSSIPLFIFSSPSFPLGSFSLTDTDKNLQWTANWTAKRRFQSLTAIFLVLIFYFSFQQLRGCVRLYISVKNWLYFIFWDFFYV